MFLNSHFMNDDFSKCSHGKWKTNCKECNPNLDCQHGRRKYDCIECMPNLYCQHGRRKTNCNECNPQLNCVHGKIVSKCRECNPNLDCQHGRLKYCCIECMPLETALARNLVCVICCIKQTRRVVCNECFKSYKGYEDGPIISVEIYIVRILLRFFPFIKFMRQARLGGQASCENSMGLELECPDNPMKRRKTAYVDIGFKYGGLEVIFEFDEFGHRPYEETCELARLDLILWARDNGDVEISSTVVLRFNPHGEGPSLLSRLKILIQSIRNILHSSALPRNDDEQPYFKKVIYFFYDKDSKHVSAAQRACAAGSAVDEVQLITDCSSIHLDPDVSSLTLEDNDISYAEFDDAFHQQNEAYATNTFCKGVSYKNTSRQHPCSAYVAKGSELCLRHKHREEAEQLAAEMNKKNA